MESEKRIYYLDFLRCLACLMVVLQHAPVPGGGLSGLVVVQISLAAAPCIGLFYMVSGALLLPAKESGFVFVKRRLGKVFLPVLIWTAVSIVLSGLKAGWPSAGELVRKVFSIPFSCQGHGVLWFMYPLVGMYLLAPVVSPWLEKASKKDLQFYLAIWGITLCFPFLGMWFNLGEGVGSLLYYFSGYLGYFILGFYLRKFPVKRVLPAILWLPVPFIALGLCKYFALPLDLSPHFWYLSIFTSLSCVSWFTIAQHLDRWLQGSPAAFKNLIACFSCCGFGIYLMHIFVMRDFLWDVCGIARLGGVGSLLVSFFGTLLLSWALTWIISHIPGGEYVVGYRVKRR